MCVLFVVLSFSSKAPIQKCAERIETVDEVFPLIAGLIKDVSKNKVFPNSFKGSLKEVLKSATDAETSRQQVADWAAAHKGVRLLIHKFAQQCRSQRSASLRE